MKFLDGCKTEEMNLHVFIRPIRQKKGTRYIRSHTALPWHVDKDYDFLRKVKPEEKLKTLSWITSSKTMAAGHRNRMQFPANLQKEIPFDLFGYGFTPIKDKWDGLSPYKYSIAIENHRNPYYWTEKIADCFLAWTMPIYCGCTRIDQYFPAEAIISIDINDPDAFDIIKDSTQRELQKKNIDAIEYARNKVLNEYQFFPFITKEINAQRMKNPASSPGWVWTLVPTTEQPSRIDSLKHQLNSYSFYRKLRDVYKKSRHVN